MFDSSDSASAYNHANGTVRIGARSDPQAVVDASGAPARSLIFPPRANLLTARLKLTEHISTRMHRMLDGPVTVSP